VQIGNCLIDPPDVPDILKSVSGIGVKMGVEVQDERKSQKAEANEVKDNRDRSLGNKRGPEKVHSFPLSIKISNRL
jgi:hypothetical protein